MLMRFPLWPLATLAPVQDLRAKAWDESMAKHDFDGMHSVDDIQEWSAAVEDYVACGSWVPWTGHLGAHRKVPRTKDVACSP